MANQHPTPLPHLPPRQILVMFEGRWEHQLAMLRGILRHATEHTNWVFRIADPEAYLRGELADWPWEGMLVQADVPARRLARKLRRDPRPVISLADTRDVADWPCVFVDNEQVARLAAEYLLSKQARKYAFIGVDFSFSKARRAAFEAALAAKGVRSETLAFFSPEQRRRSEDAKIAQLLRSWPKPVAVFAGNDHWAFWLASLCAMHGLQVPDEVAILGVDNDELICEFSHPTLSSIAVPAEESGYRGAAMLAQCLKQHTRQVESVLLAPRCVVPRRSTEIYLASDRLVNQAQRFMGEHLTERVNVKQVAHELKVSRRLLERRFLESLGHAPHAELMRLRLARAESLLQVSGKSLAEIARQCGFRDLSHFSLAFRRATGKVPSVYRQQLPASGYSDRAG